MSEVKRWYVSYEVREMLIVSRWEAIAIIVAKSLGQGGGIL